MFYLFEFGSFFPHLEVYTFIVYSICPALEFKLHSEELERWFSKIDHIFEHSRVPEIGVRNSYYKNSVDKEQHYHLPVVSPINYK